MKEEADRKMRDHKEVTCEILKKRDEYMSERKSTVKKTVIAVSVASAFILAALISIPAGVVAAGRLRDSKNETSANDTETPVPGLTDNGDHEIEIKYWYINKTTRKVTEALDKEDFYNNVDNSFGICVSFSIDYSTINFDEAKSTRNAKIKLMNADYLESIGLAESNDDYNTAIYGSPFIFVDFTNAEALKRNESKLEKAARDPRTVGILVEEEAPFDDEDDDDIDPSDVSQYLNPEIIRYCPDDIALRVIMNMDVLMKDISLAEEYQSAIALCLVTVDEINLDNFVENRGNLVPITITIDKICESSPAFALKVGDTITTSDQTFWHRFPEGYEVDFPGSYFPITEVGKQYFVMIYDDYNGIKPDFECDYTISAHSIPIFDGVSNRSIALGIYEKMKVEDDVQELSEELIAKYLSAGR